LRGTLFVAWLSCWYSFISFAFSVLQERTLHDDDLTTPPLSASSNRASSEPLFRFPTSLHAPLVRKHRVATNQNNKDETTVSGLERVSVFVKAVSHC